MADHKVKKSGAWVKPAKDQIKAKHAGTWKIVDKVWAKSGGVWTEVWTNYVPMSTPTLNITSSTKKGASLSGGFTLWSDTFTCSQPAGGIPPYTYYWEHVSGGDVFGYTDRNAASCQFGRTTIGSDYSGVYRCKVTDGASQSVYSDNVTIRLVHYDVHSAYIVNVVDSRSSGTARAGLYIRRDGTVEKRTGDVYTYSGDWVAPKSATVGDDFEIYINNDGTVAGDNSNVDAASPPLSTWGTMNVDRYAREDIGTVGSEKAGVRFRIRLRSAVGTNEQTYPIDKSVLLSANRTSPPPPPVPPPPPWSPPQVIN